jgi:hypothetical protein
MGVFFIPLHNILCTNFITVKKAAKYGTKND